MRKKGRKGHKELVQNGGGDVELDKRGDIDIVNINEVENLFTHVYAHVYNEVCLEKSSHC